MGWAPSRLLIAPPLVSLTRNSWTSWSRVLDNQCSWQRPNLVCHLSPDCFGRMPDGSVPCSWMRNVFFPSVLCSFSPKTLPAWSIVGWVTNVYVLLSSGFKVPGFRVRSCKRRCLDIEPARNGTLHTLQQPPLNQEKSYLWSVLSPPLLLFFSCWDSLSVFSIFFLL